MQLTLTQKVYSSFTSALQHVSTDINEQNTYTE